VVKLAKDEVIPANILYGDSTMLGLIALAGGNPGNPDPESEQRARVIWIKLRLKQQFPMNFMEALDPTPNAIAPSRGRPYVLLQPAPAFVQALLGKPALPWAVGQNPQPLTPVAVDPPRSFESSVCLLLALSRASKGTVSFDE